MTINDFHTFIKENFHVGFAGERKNRTLLEECIRKNYTEDFKADLILNFGMEMGFIHTRFDRTESVSCDKISFDIIACSSFTYLWNDISAVVNRVGYSENCGGTIEEFYISEYGKFYNQNHNLLAENTEDFLDYITTVEYDYHHETSERTYKMLRHFGWYEGRRIDTTAFEAELNERGITLSEAQRKFFSEFSGLSFGFKCGEDWRFYSLDEVLEMCSLKKATDRRKIKRGLIKCGVSLSADYYVNSDGIIVYLGESPAYGRTMMECINHICNISYYPEDEWL